MEKKLELVVAVTTGDAPSGLMAQVILALQRAGIDVVEVKGYRSREDELRQLLDERDAWRDAFHGRGQT